MNQKKLLEDLCNHIDQRLKNEEDINLGQILTEYSLPQDYIFTYALNYYVNHVREDQAIIKSRYIGGIDLASLGILALAGGHIGNIFDHALTGAGLGIIFSLVIESAKYREVKKIYHHYDLKRSQIHRDFVYDVLLPYLDK